MLLDQNHLTRDLVDDACVPANLDVPQPAPVPAPKPAPKHAPKRAPKPAPEIVLKFRMGYTYGKGFTAEHL